MNKRSRKNNKAKNRKSKINGGRPTIPHDSCRQIMFNNIHNSKINQIVFHSTLPILATCSHTEGTKLWRISDDYLSIEEKVSIDLYTAYRPICFHPTLPILKISGHADGDYLNGKPTINIFSMSSDYSTLNLLFSIEDKGIDVSFHPTLPIVAIGSLLYSVSEDYLNLIVREQLHNDHDHMKSRVHFHPTKPLLIASIKNQEPRLWHVKQYQPSEFLNNLPVPQYEPHIYCFFNDFSFHTTLPFIVGCQTLVDTRIPLGYGIRKSENMCLWSISEDNSPSQFIGYLTLPAPSNIQQYSHLRYLEGIAGDLTFHNILPIIIGYREFEYVKLIGSEQRIDIHQIYFWKISNTNPIPTASIIQGEGRIIDFKIHSSLPILAVVIVIYDSILHNATNTVKIYMFSDEVGYPKLIETIDNGDRSSSFIDFHPTQPILAITSGKTIKFWNCEILSQQWHKTNALTRAGIASTLIGKMATEPSKMFKNLNREAEISKRTGAISKTDPDKVSKTADRFEGIGLEREP